MPRTIPRAKATPDMIRTWDRLVIANHELDNRPRPCPSELRDRLVDEQVAAVQAYRRACRAAGYIGRNNRTRPPHLIP